MQDRLTKHQNNLMTNWMKNHILRNQSITSSQWSTAIDIVNVLHVLNNLIAFFKGTRSSSTFSKAEPQKSPTWPDEQGGVKVVIMLDNSGTELFPAWARVQQCMQTFPRSFWEKPRVQGAMSIGGDICRSTFWWAHNMFNRYCSLTTQSHHFSVNQFATCNSQSGQTPRVMTLQCTGPRRY